MIVNKKKLRTYLLNFDAENLVNSNISNTNNFSATIDILLNFLYSQQLAVNK